MKKLQEECHPKQQPIYSLPEQFFSMSLPTSCLSRDRRPPARRHRRRGRRPRVPRASSILVLPDRLMGGLPRPASSAPGLRMMCVHRPPARVPRHRADPSQWVTVCSPRPPSRWSGGCFHSIPFSESSTACSPLLRSDVNSGKRIIVCRRPICWYA